MKRRLVFVGLCLACLVLTSGQGDEDEDPLRALVREMVMNGADVDAVRNQARRDISFDPVVAEDTCTISIKGPETAHDEEDPLIAARVECGGEELFNEEKRVSELKPQTIRGNWLFLFHSTPFGGAAYVYLKGADRIDLVDLEMKNLPRMKTTTYAAPFVANGGRFDCQRCNFTNNVGGELAGAAVLGGSANVDIKRGDFYMNQGLVGGLHLLGKAKLDVEETILEANTGKLVGGIMVDETAMLITKQLYCMKNKAEEHSTEIYLTGKTSGILDETHLVGEGYSEDYAAFLTDPTSTNHAINEDALPKTSAIKFSGKALFSVRDTNFSSNAGKYGALVISEESVVGLLACHFEKNAAMNGAGIYVEGGRGGYARVLDSTFVENVARNGGGMVSAGNGTFVIDECIFESNRAFRGGAVWGDYSNEDSLVNASCTRASAGSRMTITKSSFGNNAATDSGGAFYIKCTDILTEKSTFTENGAASNGGAMYVADVHDLEFKKCNFSQNRAGLMGGSLFTENSHDILSTDSFFIDSAADSSGGAIASLNGHGIYLTNSKVTSNKATTGGAVYSLDVEMIHSEKSDLSHNSADEGGAFSVHNLNELYLDDVDLSSNTASNVGGAVRAYNGDKATMKNIIVTDITAGSGSLSLAKMDIVSVSDIDFHDNIAEKTCGALEVDEARDVQLLNLSVRKNVAKQEGGGVCIKSAHSVDIQHVKFNDNSAGMGGGAVSFFNNKKVHISHTEFVDNYGTFQGGAIKGKGVDSILVTFSSFERNEAQLRGGAIFLEKSSLEIQDSNVTKNYVGQPKPKQAPAEEKETAEVGKEETIAPEAETETAEAGKTKTTASEAEAVEAGKTETKAPEAKPEATEGDETVAKATEETESDAPKETNGFLNTVLATDAGGVIYVSRGKHFKSIGTQYTLNEAQSVGGALMVEDMDLVRIEFDRFVNGTASMSGGCIYGANIRNFSIWDTVLQYCDASHGGAFTLEGNSISEGGYNSFINNTADSGGAFLCKGNSRVNLKSTNFTYNAAHEGATVSVDCRCDVDVANSVFYREKELKDNGDFFHVRKGCGSVNHNGCEFYGEMDHGGLNALEIGLGGGLGALLVVFIIFVVLARRRSKKRAAERGDIESGPSAPLLPPSRHPVAASTEGSSSYETETDEDESGASEEVTDRDENPRKRASTRSVASSETEEISSDETENDTEEEEITAAEHKPRSIPTVPVVQTAPIGLRTPKEVRAAARHRKASMDALNDGAGPSMAASPDILPPTLPPQLKLCLSMSSESPGTSQDTVSEEKHEEQEEEGEIQPVKAERQPTIPEDTV